MREAAAREGVDLVDVVQDVESGAKQRDGLDDVWARVRAGEAEGILFGKTDRLGRSQLHLASLVEQARAEGISLLSSDEGWQVRRGDIAVELDALPPNVLQALVREHLDQFFDVTAFAEEVAREQDEQKRLDALIRAA